MDWLEYHRNTPLSLPEQGIKNPATNSGCLCGLGTDRKGESRNFGGDRSVLYLDQGAIETHGIVHLGCVHFFTMCKFYIRLKKDIKKSGASRSG